MLNKIMRKTRKHPYMIGSIRKRKSDCNFAKRFDKWLKLYNCKYCVSDPICINSQNV